MKITSLVDYRVIYLMINNNDGRNFSGRIRPEDPQCGLAPAPEIAFDHPDCPGIFRQMDYSL